MGQEKQRGTKEQRILEPKQRKSDDLNFKIDTIKLQQSLLSVFADKVGTLIGREEYDLLIHALLTSNNVGFVRFFSYCENTDFAITTYEKLHEKITSIYPTLKLDKKIRFFHNSAYTLRTQEQIEAIVEEKYLKPTPLNEICTAKNLSVRWFQHGDNNHVAMKHLPIINSFAKDLSKAILSNAKDDSFSWSKDKHGDLDGCSIGIETVGQLLHLLGPLIHSPSKTAQEKIVELKDAITQANKLEGDAGITIFFKTKRPTADKSERKAWVQPTPTHYTLTDLKERKWNNRLIEKHLVEPDVYFENKRNMFAPTHGYEIARVKSIEKTSAFKADFQLNRKKLVKIAK